MEKTAIRIGLIQLEMYATDGRKPSKALLDDIAGYRWILEHDRAEEVAKEFLAMRPVTKIRDAVAKLKGSGGESD